VDKLLKVLWVILFSSVKFALGPSFVYLNEKYNFSFLQTNIYCILGGMLGVAVFLYLSKWILKIYHRVRVIYFHTFRRKKLFIDPVADVSFPVKIKYEYMKLSVPKKRVFTPRSRKIVRLWQTYGLFGLAALTPILFSIPLGTFIMSRFESNNKRIILFMFISIICWSLILTSFFELTHVRNLEEMVKWESEHVRKEESVKVSRWESEHWAFLLSPAHFLTLSLSSFSFW